MRQKGIEPEALKNMPEVPARLRFDLENFYLLNRDRRYEQGTPLPITNSQIRDFFTMFDLDHFWEFHGNMVMMDKAYLEVQSEKSEKQRKDAENKSKKSSPPPRRR